MRVGAYKTMKKKTWIILTAVVLVLALVLGGAAFVAVKFGPRFGFYLVPPSARAYGEQALAQIDAYGFYAAGDAWRECYDECLAALEDVEGYIDCHAVIERALAVGGGKHSFLQTELEAAEQAAESVLPQAYMQGDVAVITLPAFTGDAARRAEYAAVVEDFLHENRAAIRGAVVDLRGNTGGDCGPMLTALSQLLPDGELVSYAYAGYDLPVTLSNGALSNAGSGGTSQYPGEKLDVPVAVLTDDRTGSSGELVLLCFRGLENTRSFGAPTAGYCSVNRAFSLYDGSVMYLTVAADKARTGEIFEADPIAPDETADDPLEAALAWLSGRG